MASLYQLICSHKSGETWADNDFLSSHDGQGLFGTDLWLERDWPVTPEQPAHFVGGDLFDS
jgi:hypothetical protein